MWQRHWLDMCTRAVLSFLDRVGIDAEWTPELVEKWKREKAGAEKDVAELERMMGL